MYKQIKNVEGVIYANSILRTQDNAVIPFDPANTDYQQYLKFLEEGGQPLPADERTQ